MNQYYIVLIFVVVIVCIQFFRLVKNLSLISQLKNLFPHIDDLVLDVESNNLICTTDNEDFKETLKDINAYLGENKNKSADYHIIKEIVERNSQKLEDDVDTMLSSPLYLGLMATIFGAAVGIYFFANNDLQGLLMGTQVTSDGITTLLIDIAIAMGASFVGVLCTSCSTLMFKDAKGTMTHNKNVFLTWIQTNVMPKMTDNLSDALTKMAQDLNVFNSTFAENTRELKSTLSQVSDNYDNQVQLLDAIDRIKINKIAEANIKVYDKLQGCTDEIGHLLQHVERSGQYIERVVELNNQLGNIEERTKLCEDLGAYFKQEMEFIQNRQGIIRQDISRFDSLMQQTFQELSTSLSTSISGLTIVFQQQNQHVQTLIEEQQSNLRLELDRQREIVNQKAAEFGNPFAGLNETYQEVCKQSKNGIDKIVAAFSNQNESIKEMLQTQKALLESELLEQREEIEKQISSSPLHIDELVAVIEKLNATVEYQKKTIERQSSSIDLMVSSFNSSIPRKKEGLIPKVSLVLFSGSFLFLLAIILILLFDIKL